MTPSAWKPVDEATSAWKPVQEAPAAPNPSMNATISATPDDAGIGGKVSRWAQNVMDDIRYGTDTTGVGQVLSKMGAHGVYNGAPEKVGEYMASLPLGLLRSVKGGGEVAQGKLKEGATDVGAGALQASQIPSAFIGGPEAAAAGQGGAATKAVTETGKVATAVAKKVSSVIPNAERAGQGFSQVMSAAGDVPVNISTPGNTALRIQELASSGGSMPKVVRDFLKRVTDPDKGALTYSEARDFYSNASRLSADEAQRLTPVMRMQVAKFRADLDTAISGAADKVGKLDQYRSSMEEYHKAMRIRALGQGLKDAATSTAAKTVAATGAGAAGAYLMKKAVE